ncbi:putative ATP-dependent RNA helicase ddx60 [Phytophthora boehmeriae]|uniref:Putative ATP-dependent RNA helicase ddx60 n=1 Tax=Phytophthora boehmeriae TaxID=109152 RepID=A0A8T1X377_9STRA|nr:putative ATP-dependent RNA helicase ddx60 [Phytophthora boehmeriae]
MEDTTNVSSSQSSRAGNVLLPKQKPGDLPGRPFTTIGGSLFHLDSTAPSASIPGSPQRRQQRPPATADAIPSRQQGAIDGEFDVRKFLLDQKATQPLHKSALFRASNFAKQLSSMEMPQTEAHDRNSHSRSKKRRALPRMELGPSKSVGMLPGVTRPNKSSHSHRSSSGNGEHNQRPDEENNTAISHFYSVEKMAESCFHATQNMNKTWLLLPGSDERSKSSNGTSSIRGSSITGVERPSRRVDVLDLDRCFDTAIEFVTKKKHWDIACDEKLSMIDRDFMAIHARIAQRYESGTAVNENASERHKTLSKLLFEQKWSDVVIGELEAMLMVSFLEQGVVLRKARILYAKAFFQLEHLYKHQWQELTQEKEDLQLLREEVRQTNELHQQNAESMKEYYEGEIQKLTLNFEGVKSDMERRVTDSKDQLAKMAETMKALNGIFRQMRDDTEKVKAVELRENYIKLEQKYDQCREEVEHLRPLVHEKQQLLDKLDELNRDYDACKEQVTTLNQLVSTKDALIASLMEQQSDLIAAQELRAARNEELLKRAKEEEEEEREVAIGDASSSVPSTTVCVRCKQDLRNMSANGVLAEGDKGPSEGEGNFKIPMKKKRVQCLYFRILLPNLGGRRPQREMGWTFSCMRSILFAKQIDDAMCKRTGGLAPLRIRMPEFVYSWFSPWRSMQEEKAIAEVEAVEDEVDITIDNSSDTAESMEKRQRQADEDRWCLYYGVRSLVQQGYLEAKLFLSLLDEKFGEDEQVFMLHCYRVLDVLLEGHLNWGPLRDKLSYENFAQEYDALYDRNIKINPEDGASASTPQAPRPRVPKTIWISPYHASLATSVLLSKATEAERAALDKKIMDFVITNVPEDERPAIYLVPTESSATGMKNIDVGTDAHIQTGPKLDRSGKSRTIDDVDDDTHAAPVFVDANLWVELMMLEYKEEQAHRRAAIRLMFQTATTSAATSTPDTTASMSLSAMLGINCASMDMEQFRVMIHTLNDEIPTYFIATLYRNAYTCGNGSVNFDSFIDAAETWQFFSTCMRLESPSTVVTRLFGNPLSHTPAVASASSRAAFIVHKFFTILQNELHSTIKALPIWTRNLTDSLAYEISSSLLEGTYCDGVRLLTSFYRLIDCLGVAKLVRRDITGSLFSSKDLLSIERALEALLKFVRQQDQSAVEFLIDTIKQTLCIRRLQATFRKHLLHDQGAPLVMRSLMHRRYGSGFLDFSERKAERPIIWLHLVISSILRQSMQSTRVPALLGELSSVSSALQAAQPSSVRLIVSSSLNGGIGPTPKPLFVELIYDFFLEKFGTRCEAERLIHDLFYNCRSLVRTDSLAALFSHLCCMSHSCPEDRLLGQNEALSFLHAIFRCGLHNFHLINPVPWLPGDTLAESDDIGADSASDAAVIDYLPVTVVETILQTAFDKLSADQKARLSQRIVEAASDHKNGTPLSRMEANAFLVFALQEWRRYIIHRLNEVRVNFCAVEDDSAQLGELLNLETIAAILQKSGIRYRSEDLCVIFRRLNITERAPKGSKPEKGAEVSTSTAVHDPMSDRIAAACFPMVAKEALNELSALERASSKRFKVQPSPLQSYELLVSSWGDYQASCSDLLDDLRRVSNNGIQTKSLSRTLSRSDGGDDLYLSSSSSKVSSQDVAHLESVQADFLYKLERLTELFDQTSSSYDDSRAAQREANTQETMVDEAWKAFRQMFVRFIKLRATARLGQGPLPDQWATTTSA